MRSDPIETVLEAVLNAYQVRVEIVTNVRYCGDWYEKEPETARGQFHLIGEGCCQVTGAMFPDPIELEAGDFVVFPRGAAHVLAARQSSPHGPAPRFTSMLCGELEFVSGERSPIFAALPSHLVVRGAQRGDRFRQLASILTAVSAAGETGHQVVEDKLADCLFTMAVCDFARTAQNPTGIFAALADARIARALSAIHSRPGVDWTIQALAERAAMSRTAFARLFGELLGKPPIEYLSEWRVSEAKRLLRDRTLSVGAVAEKLGYQSEAAFRRMFKRIEGIGPGKVRAVPRRLAPKSGRRSAPTTNN